MAGAEADVWPIAFWRNCVGAYFFVAFAFNFGSYCSPRPFTLNDPVKSSLKFAIVAGLEAALIFTRFEVLYQYIFGGLFASILYASGILKHLLTPYHKSKLIVPSGPLGSPRLEIFHPWMWVAATIINCLGVGAHLGLAFSTSINWGAVALFAVLAICFTYYMVVSERNKYQPKDAPWYSQPSAKQQKVAGSTPPYAPCPTPSKPAISRYLRMRDGVDIAVDVYFPGGSSSSGGGGDGEDGGPFPVFLHLTRYNRNWLVHPPYSALFGRQFNMRSMRYVHAFTPRGYAVVTVDVRGTGASSGSRPVDLHPDEVADYVAVLEWVRRQRWCNGQVGSGGISYDALTAVSLGAQAPLQAIIVCFAPMDVYEDIVFPGGLPCTGFADSYHHFTDYSEKVQRIDDGALRLPSAMLRLLFGRALQHVTPVGAYTMRGSMDEAEEGAGGGGGGGVMRPDPMVALWEAIEQHRAGNWDLSERLRGLSCKDDIIVRTAGGQAFTAVNIGPSPDTLAALGDSGAAVRTYCGYFDSGAIVAAERIHAAVGPQRSSLVIGPWTHGARQTCSPFLKQSKNMHAVSFDVFQDMANFLDQHLQTATGGPPTGPGPATPPIHYFTMGAEQWQASQHWPPQHSSDVAFPLTATGGGDAGASPSISLPAPLRPADAATAAPAAATVSEGGSGVDFTVDLSHTTGVASRWNLVQHVCLQPVTYRQRAEQDRAALCFTSPPCACALTVSGTPWLSLSLALADGSDAAVFAYLEDVAADGTVRYITEGQLRLSHSVDPSLPDHRGQLYPVHQARARSFLAADRRPLTPGRRYTVRFNLHPVSHTFAAGHSVRLALAGADADNFLLDTLPDLASGWRVFTAPSQTTAAASDGAAPAAAAGEGKAAAVEDSDDSVSSLLYLPVEGRVGGAPAASGGYNSISGESKQQAAAAGRSDPTTGSASATETTALLHAGHP